MSRPQVWKHDCLRDGQGNGQPCDPLCEDPWQVDLPKGWGGGGAFETWKQAVTWAVGKLIERN